MDDIDFCNITASIYNDIVKLCSSKITTLTKSEVEKIYSNWEKAFNGYILKCEEFNKLKSIISKGFSIPVDADHLGIDFPTWINFKGIKEERKRIMIVGIDPLRREPNSGNVELGTPYALHLESMRVGGTKQYWQFIKLLSKNHSIYLTDIYKVFYYNAKPKRSYNDLEFTGNCYHEEILKHEIEIVKPDIIIAMGKKATELISGNKLSQPISSTAILSSILQKKYNTIPIIPMVHLSGLATKYINAFLSVNGKSSGDYGTNYYEIIDDYLKS